MIKSYKIDSCERINPMSQIRSFGPRMGKKPTLIVGITLALFIFGSAFSLLMVTSTALTPTFRPAINLSNDNGVAKDATISNNGLNVYVAWTEGSKGVLFRMSPDGGITWVPPTTSPALKLSPKGGVAQFPVMFTQFQNVSSGDVYVTWSQTVTQANGSKILQAFVAASQNNGVSFITTQLSHNATNSQNTPAIGAWGSNVYVSWFSAKNSVASGSIYVSSSTNNGKTWSAARDVLNPIRNGESEVVATTNGLAYLVADGIYFSDTNNSGATWTPQLQLFSVPHISSTSIYYGREPWVAGSGKVVSAIWEANSTTPGISYHDQGVTSTDGGKTWGPIQNITDPLKDNWEPENVAFNGSIFMTFHSLQTQGIYVTSSLNVASETPTWTPGQLVSPTKLKSSFGHIATSDGVNVFVMWGQQISSGSSTWNAYVSYSGNKGVTWSTPIDISNNAVGVAAGNQDVTLFGMTSNGAHCYAAWTYTNGGASQIYFAGS